MTDKQDTFRAGVEQFNQKQFFECHDTWESIWMESKGEEKLFLQGLIQIAVGYFHASNGKYHAAISQFSKGIAKVSSLPPNYYGVKAENLLLSATSHAAACEAIISGKVTLLDSYTIPQIQFS